MKLKALIAVLFIICSFACNKEGDINDPSHPDYLHGRSVGASANELLSSSKFSSLKIEVQYMTGFAPDAAALDHLRNFLSAYLNKSLISVTTKEIGGTANTTLDVNAIEALEKQNRSAFTNGNEIALYILYTNGQYSNNQTLGVAYKNTSAALFGKTIRDNSGGLGQVNRTKLEATVLEHEVGHLLGLVDIGSVMQTPHKANGNHCNNNNCLMYFASETTDVLGFLLTGNIPSLDANCVADLRANGGK